MKAASRLLTAATQRCTLEVERKFRGLTVPTLTKSTGTPPFRSLRDLGTKTLQDTYYDRNNVLAFHGVWLRLRDGHWEAKVRKGGTFTNSHFEELTDPEAIRRYIYSLTSLDRDHRDHYGLDTTAILNTTRQSWLADEEFTIVLDTMDFGHTVGEVELERSEVLVGQTEADIAQLKAQKMKEMDERIIEFMQHYSWAFLPGEPVGKLTAYFQRKRQRRL